MKKAILVSLFFFGTVRTVLSQNSQVDWIYEFGEPKWWHWPFVLAMIFIASKFIKRKYDDDWEDK